MIKIVKGLVVIAISACGSFLNAQEATSFTLEEAKNYAIQNSKDIALKQVELNQARLKVKESLSYLLPQVNGDLKYVHYGKLNSTIIPAGTFGLPESQVIQFGLPENVTAEITATQTIFNGVILVGFKAADIFVHMTEQEKVVKIEDLKDMVSRSYYNVLLARESAEIVAKNIKNLEALYKDTKILFDNGLVEEIDVDRLTLSLANLKTQVNSLENNVKLTEVVLKFQMGYPIDNDIQLVQELSDFVDSSAAVFPEKGSFENRSELHLMNLREQVNLTNIKRLKFSNLPSLTAFSSLSSSAQRDKFSFFRYGENYPWFNVRYFGVQLSVPIWDSFGRRAKVNSAKEDLQRIRIGREQLMESFKLSYQKARLDYSNAINEYNNVNRNLILAEKIYKVAQIKYKEGVGSSLELTNAEQQLYTTQATLVNAMYKVLVAKTDINKAMGNN
ncbi:MAG: TolC family protein [Chitinophagales bacterium]|nr:TolC family protein [Chitinophagales bacterium]MCZ2392489.1 TolC family protein [Chitinophagales bacterium]